MARATLEVPLVHRVVRAAAPDEVATLTDAALPAVRVCGEGMPEPVRFVVQRDPQEVDRAVALMAREHCKLVEVRNRRRAVRGFLVCNDRRAGVVARDDDKVERRLKAGIERVGVERAPKGLLEQAVHFHAVDVRDGAEDPGSAGPA